MGKRAEQHGGEPPSGTRASGYGWMRPGYLDMPAPSNDNRMAPRSLLRHPRFWGWLALIALAVVWGYSRL
jgi:hypothetical protein